MLWIVKRFEVHGGAKIFEVYVSLRAWNRWRLCVTQAGKPGAEPDDIQKDIERVGAAGWLQLLMTDIPVEHGVQRLTGYALVDENGIQYGGCVVDGV